MYQLITGHLPFGKLEDENDLVRYQKRGKAGEWDRMCLLSVPVGRQWECLISKCLEPNLKDRIQTAAEALALLPIKHGTPSPAYELASSVTSQAIRGTALRIMQGCEDGKVYDLESLMNVSGRRLLTIGRGGYNSINLVDFSDSYLSRKHCTLENRGQHAWILRDGQWDPERVEWISSTNGTFVNSDVVGHEGRLLHAGDILTLGDMKLRFETF